MMRRGDLDKAIADFTTAIGLDPLSVHAYGNRGWAYQRKRDNQKALADYTKAIELEPKDLLGYNQPWPRLSHHGQSRFAPPPTMARPIRVAPTDARGWRNRGMIKLMKYDNAGGIADYDKALEYDPKDAYSWNNRGIAKRDTGDKIGAIADFKKALEINPNLPSTRQALEELGAKP